MDSPMVFITAVALCLCAIVLVIFVVFKPRFGAIPFERRRMSVKEDQSTISRMSQTAVGAVGRVIGDAGGPYNREVLYNAGLKTAPADFTAGVGIASIIIGAFTALLTHPFLGILAAIATPFLAKVALILLRDKRRAKFEEQLTDTIEMLIGGLRVGHSILRSVEAAARGRGGGQTGRHPADRGPPPGPAPALGRRTRLARHVLHRPGTRAGAGAGQSGMAT